MKNNSTRFIAILAAAATLATGASFATTASAAEPVTSQVNLSMDVTDMTDDMLLGMLDPEIRSAFDDLCASGLLSGQERHEVLEQLVESTTGPQTYSKVSAIKTVLKVVSKIFKGVKWLDKLTGFLDNVENWSEDKIAGFLKDQGGDSSTAHSVAKIIVGILL